MWKRANSQETIETEIEPALNDLDSSYYRSRRSAALALGMLAGDTPKTREALNELAARDPLSGGELVRFRNDPAGHLYYFADSTG